MAVANRESHESGGKHANAVARATEAAVGPDGWRCTLCEELVDRGSGVVEHLAKPYHEMKALRPDDADGLGHPNASGRGRGRGRRGRGRGRLEDREARRRYVHKTQIVVREGKVREEAEEVGEAQRMDVEMGGEEGAREEAAVLQMALLTLHREGEEEGSEEEEEATQAM
ncbi:hypothetical protein BDW22DRAFT_1431474 [Trametopsis cervina]|nr:hypothetical protein BDW22DRAFT_1431474 [Trametopsis cervina]